jgi:hypothetical protein
MERRMLLGVKERAEGGAVERKLATKDVLQ